MHAGPSGSGCTTRCRHDMGLTLPLLPQQAQETQQASTSADLFLVGNGRCSFLWCVSFDDKLGLLRAFCLIDSVALKLQSYFVPSTGSSLACPAVPCSAVCTAAIHLFFLFRAISQLRKTIGKASAASASAPLAAWWVMHESLVHACV